MRDFEFGKIVTFKFKCIALVILAVAFIVAFIPLWQLGVDNTVRQQMIASQLTLQELDSEERALRAVAIDYSEVLDNTVASAKVNTII